MTWRTLLIDVPALIMTVLWYAYWTLIAIAAVACLIAATLTLALSLAGLPFERPAPLTPPLPPSGPHARLTLGRGRF